MNPRDFCYWFRGFLEIEDPSELSKDQLAMVKEHLELVFENVTSKDSKKELLTDSIDQMSISDLPLCSSVETPEDECSKCGSTWNLIDHGTEWLCMMCNQTVESEFQKAVKKLAKEKAEEKKNSGLAMSWRDPRGQRYC